MRVDVRHRTTYRYETPVERMVERLRLTPPQCSWQHVVDWRIDVEGIREALRYADAFGNAVHLVNVPDGATEIGIVAQGTVETDPSSHAVTGVASSVPDALFLRETLATRPDETVREMAHEVRRTDILDTAHALMDTLATRVAYRTGVTDGETRAVDALAQGEGVCQDHAHLFCAAMRVLGVPARYVNGYMALEGEAEAHHAWAEALVPGLGWVGFDVSNRRSPTDIYVRLATGLDAVSAAPIRGVRRGGMNETLDVGVHVAQQQQ